MTNRLAIIALCWVSRYSKFACMGYQEEDREDGHAASREEVALGGLEKIFIKLDFLDPSRIQYNLQFCNEMLKCLHMIYLTYPRIQRSKKCRNSIFYIFDLMLDWVSKNHEV